MKMLAEMKLFLVAALVSCVINTEAMPTNMMPLPPRHASAERMPSSFPAPSSLLSTGAETQPTMPPPASQGSNGQAGGWTPGSSFSPQAIPTEPSLSVQAPPAMLSEDQFNTNLASNQVPLAPRFQQQHVVPIRAPAHQQPVSAPQPVAYQQQPVPQRPPMNMNMNNAMPPPNYHPLQQQQQQPYYQPQPQPNMRFQQQQQYALPPTVQQMQQMQQMQPQQQQQQYGYAQQPLPVQQPAVQMQQQQQRQAAPAPTAFLQQTSQRTPVNPHTVGWSKHKTWSPPKGAEAYLNYNPTRPNAPTDRDMEFSARQRANSPPEPVLPDFPPAPVIA